MPFLSKSGRAINSTKEGIIIHRILLDKLAIFSTFFVSTYSQINANNEVNGREANMAATVLYLLPNSETAKMINAESKILMMY